MKDGLLTTMADGYGLTGAGHGYPITTGAGLRIIMAGGGILRLMVGFGLRAEGGDRDGSTGAVTVNSQAGILFHRESG